MMSELSSPSTTGAAAMATGGNVNAGNSGIEGGDQLRLGSIVDIKPCYSKQNFQGEIIAYDQASKVLILKCQNADKKTDVRMINMGFVLTMNVITEANTNVPQAPQQINLEKLNTKARKNIEERERLAKAISAGVSSDGINVFLAIRKTIDDVTWHDKSIIVMNCVMIQPPYKPENCGSFPSQQSHNNRGDSNRDNPGDSQSVVHVRKIVEKHMKDSQRSSTNSQPTTPGGGGGGGGGGATSVTSNANTNSSSVTSSADSKSSSNSSHSHPHSHSHPPNSNSSNSNSNASFHNSTKH